MLYGSNSLPEPAVYAAVDGRFHDAGQSGCFSSVRLFLPAEGRGYAKRICKHLRAVVAEQVEKHSGGGFQYYIEYYFGEVFRYLRDYCSNHSDHSYCSYNLGKPGCVPVLFRIGQAAGLFCLSYKVCRRYSGFMCDALDDMPEY